MAQEHHLSGLELLEAMRDGDIAHPTAAESTPMRTIEVTKGRVLFHARADQRHLNPLGATHGGFAATVMDAITGCAILSALPAGQTLTTTDLNVKMLRPIPQDITLIAEGALINLSKNLGIAEGRIQDDNGKLFAHGTATCMIIRG